MTEETKKATKPFVTRDACLVQAIWKATSKEDYAHLGRRIDGLLASSRRKIEVKSTSPNSLNRSFVKEYVYSYSKEEIEKKCKDNGHPIDLGA